MTIRLVMFPSLGTTTRLSIEIASGTTIEEIEAKVLDTSNLPITEKELATANCLVDGLFVEKDYSISGDEKEISFVNQLLGGC